MNTYRFKETRNVTISLRATSAWISASLACYKDVCKPSSKRYMLRVTRPTQPVAVHAFEVLPAPSLWKNRSTVPFYIWNPLSCCSSTTGNSTSAGITVPKLGPGEEQTLAKTLLFAEANNTWRGPTLHLLFHVQSGLLQTVIHLLLS